VNLRVSSVHGIMEGKDVYFNHVEKICNLGKKTKTGRAADPRKDFYLGVREF